MATRLADAAHGLLATSVKHYEATKIAAPLLTAEISQRIRHGGLIEKELAYWASIGLALASQVADGDIYIGKVSRDEEGA